MFYAWDITVPANTPEAAPVKKSLSLSYGVISGVGITFPNGCNGMVKVHLKRWTFQLIPLSPQEWVTGNGETVPTEPSYELLETPFELEFEACSPSTTYQHIITVRVEIKPAVTTSDQQVIDTLNKIAEELTPNA